MTIFYGGTRENVERQLTCHHDWYGPCVDKISRYDKCKTCYCINRDCLEEEYYQALGWPDDETDRAALSEDYLKLLLEIVTRLLPPSEGKNHTIILKDTVALKPRDADTAPRGDLNDIVFNGMRLALRFELPDETFLVPIFSEDFKFSPDEAARRILFRGKDVACCIKETAWAIDIAPPPN